jgi:hypothetical protein
VRKDKTFLSNQDLNKLNFPSGNYGGADVPATEQRAASWAEEGVESVMRAATPQGSRQVDEGVMVLPFLEWPFVNQCHFRLRRRRCREAPAAP